MRIVAGVIGAVAGFFAGIAFYSVAGFENKYDPITSGLTALLIFGPLGMIGGLVLAIKLAMLATGPRAAARTAPDKGAAAQPAGESLLNGSLKSLAVVVGLIVVGGGGYAWYAIATATPWLYGIVAMEFEIRYPPGTVLPPAKDMTFELQTDLNTMPGEARPEKFRNDGDRPVIAGQVDLAFRTRNRQLEVTMPGRPDRIYQIHLAAKPPHTKELGRWEPHPDGSEVRYRASWAGQD